MSQSDPQDPTSSPGTPVPDLIEQYRIRRDAWIAQADELARLRDEVRGSAEREAMEIVTAARRDVRQIVMEARRELLVLSAQVQAALGEAGARPDPAALLNRARDNDEGPASDVRADFSDVVFAPDEAVKGMLDEARADMEALAEDARTVPFQALETPPAPNLALPLPSVPHLNDTPSRIPPSVSPASNVASRVLLSSPFPNESVPVPSGRRMRTFVTLFGLAGVAVVAGTIWWLRTAESTSPNSGDAATTATTVSTPAPAAAPSAAPAAAQPKDEDRAAETASSTSGLSLVVEARRSAWIRTTVDGQSDDGRTVNAGETFRVTARRSVSFRVGDAGAVYVSVNKGEALPLGRDGQVVTRQFVLESADVERAPAVGPTPSKPTPSEPLPPPARTDRLPGPLAAAPRAPATPTPNVPLVQPVASVPAGPPLEAATSPPPARTEATVPPPTARAELPTPGPSSPASAVIAASRQWLEAYHRQDRSTMASLSTDGLQLADERRNEERFPSGVEVTRTLDRVSVQIAADTAVLTAVMTERAADSAAAPRVSPISQVWVLSGNQWRVRQVRLVSEARLNQIFR